MAISWKTVKSGYSQIGVDWNVTSDTDTSITYAPIVYLYYNVNSSDPYINYSWDLTLGSSSITNGSTALSTNGAFSGQKAIDTFATRTVTKKTSKQTLTLELDFGDLYGGYGSGWTGSWSGTWTYTVSALPTYTITYDANGGSLGSVSSTVTKTHGVDLTVPTAEPTKTGYNFVEWNTAADGSGHSVLPGGSITANESKTMYAIWKIAASVVTLYLPNESGVVEKKRGMVHMYNSDGNLCYAIITIYDETGKRYLAN